MVKQFILAACGIILTASIFFFGRTVAHKVKSKTPVATQSPKSFDIQGFIEQEKKQLSSAQLLDLSKIENSIKRGDISTQQVQVNTQLANYWKDSLHAYEPYAWYLSQAAKLDKSEKNLTFAGQLILANLRGEPDDAKLAWEADLAIDLFKSAIELDPNNDDLKVGLASCYVYGKGKVSGPQETMKGITQLLDVVRRDSTNMKAQLVLGVGGYVSGQYDKAIDRFKKVIRAQPENLEAVAMLADTYAAKGENEQAVTFYELSKKLAHNPEYDKEVDKRIRELR